MTLTIELPDETAERAHAVAAARGLDVNSFALAALIDAVDAEQEDAHSVNHAEVIAAIEEGIADANAGRFITLEAWRTQIDAGGAASHSFRAY